MNQLLSVLDCSNYHTLDNYSKSRPFLLHFIGLLFGHSWVLITKCHLHEALFADSRNDTGNTTGSVYWPVSRKSLKATSKTAIRLFRKSGLLTCLQDKKEQTVTSRAKTILTNIRSNGKTHGYWTDDKRVAKPFEMAIMNGWTAEENFWTVCGE